MTNFDVVTSTLQSSFGDWLTENTDYYQLFVHQAEMSREDILQNLTPIWVCKNIWINKQHSLKFYNFKSRLCKNLQNSWVESLSKDLVLCALPASLVMTRYICMNVLDVSIIFRHRFHMIMSKTFCIIFFLVQYWPVNVSLKTIV